MPDRTEISVGEYESVRLDDGRLTSRDVDRLRGLQSGKHLTLTGEREGWRITAGGTVGVLVLDRIRLAIRPKFAIPGGRLMDWLSYALGVPVPAPPRGWTTSHDGYTDLVAAALLEQCEQLVRTGLRRDYVRSESVEQVLRGRLDVAAQVTRRYGRLDRLHIRTFDREAGIRDNRVLATALRAALPLTIGSGLARELHRVAAAFPPPVSPAAALQDLDRIAYTRLNSRYRAAHAWSRLILRGGGVSDLLDDGDNPAEGLLLAMPALWEAVVRRLGASLGGRVVPGGGENAITVRGDLGKASAFRPDLVLGLPVDGVEVLLPVDAKYKRYDRHGVSSADVHQLLTYGAGYTSGDGPRAVIVHPGTGFTRRVLRVDGPYGRLGTVHVVGIDTRATPEEAEAYTNSIGSISRIC
ncbi:PE-PGRS family protein [Streptomyces sp. V2]|uniref:McrC family protein n=1 Tax=Streptomyces sp. V2 TaxID=1424099 RepID=UPI000D66D233|nr:PE-PGRS family protein [Streptomyces sp. V2]PWG12303.1 PE-PGRS family protein [Streptomyces sp. V2]